MRKIKHIDLFDLNDRDIEFLFEKNSIKKPNMCDTSHDSVSAKVSNQKKIIAQTLCPTCLTIDNVVFDNNSGIIVCSKCGNVFDDVIFDHAPEWKNFEDSNNTARCNTTVNCLLPQMSMSTTIGGSYNYKLKTLHTWCNIPYDERSLSNVFTVVKKICEKNHLPKCVEDDAKILYKKAIDFKGDEPNKVTRKNSVIVRGKNRTGLIAACLYYSCKRYGMAKSIKEISGIFQINPTRVNKGCKNFIKYTKNLGFNYTNISLPSHYVTQFCERLNLEKCYVDEITAMTDSIQKINSISSHTPLSIAAACVYACVIKHSLTKITKSKISDIFGISDVTITKTYNQLHSHNMIYGKENIEIIQHNDIVPKELLEKINIVNSIDVMKYSEKNEFDIDKCLSINISEHMVDVAKKCKDFIKQMEDI